MPSLVLFGQKTGVSGDDLRVGCLIQIALSLMEFVVLAPIMTYVLQVNTSQHECLLLGGLSDHGIVLFHLYWVLSLFVALLSIGLEIVLLRISSKGTPTEPEQRSNLKTICYILLGPYTLLKSGAIACGILSIRVMNDYCNCSAYKAITKAQEESVTIQERCPNYRGMHASFSVLLYTQIVEVGFSALVYAFLLLAWTRPRQRLVHLLRCNPVRGLTWNIACKICCTFSSVVTCCLFGGSQAVLADYSNISLLLTDLGDDEDDILDVTSSDVVAGLFMVVREQEQKREECVAGYSDLVREQRATAAAAAAASEADHNHDLHSQQREEEEQLGSTAAAKEGCTATTTTATACSPSTTATTTKIVTKIQMRRGSSRGRSSDSDNDDDDDDDNDDVSNHQQQYYRYWYETECRAILSKEEPADRQVIAAGAHFMRLALSIYGYLMYTINHPFTAPCYLSAMSASCQTSCCRCRFCGGGGGGSGSKTVVLGDTLCGCNHIAFLKQAGLTGCGITTENNNSSSVVVAYLSFRQGIRASPYGIVIDHAWESIVIVVRGTLCLEDAVADLSVRPVKLDHVGERYGFNGCGEYCHEGMLGCAEWIYSDIEEHGILHSLLHNNRGNNNSGGGGDGGDDHPHASDMVGGYHTYKLYVVGHSLGAGTSAVLSLMLKAKYPEIQCLSFEPPGCVLSEGIANQEHVTSFVLGSDIVPRLSLHAVENLRDDVLEMITRIKVPKHEVLETYRFKHCCKKVSLLKSNADLIHGRESIPETEFKRQLGELKEFRSRARQRRDMDDVRLVQPGRLVHLIQTSVDRGGVTIHNVFSFEGKSSKTTTFTPVWAKREDFAEIQLTKTFLTDHDPLTVLTELERVAESFGLVPPYLEAGVVVKAPDVVSEK